MKRLREALEAIRERPEAYTFRLLSKLIEARDQWCKKFPAFTVMVLAGHIVPMSVEQIVITALKEAEVGDHGVRCQEER